jgi:hypothetical protein
MQSIFSAITNNTLKRFGVLGVMNWKNKFWLSIQKPLTSTFGLFKEYQMKSKIITALIEWTLAIIIFGGIGVLLAWRG